MNKRPPGAPATREELAHFTNREPEQAAFERLVGAPAGASLPVLTFYGVGGAGKTWLTRRLRQTLQQGAALPSARVDFDPMVGGRTYSHDSASTLAEIRRQLAAPCPRFDLAYAMLRHKQGAGDEPLFRLEGSAALAWELVSFVGNQAISNLPGGNLVLWVARKAKGPLARRLQESALGEWLISAAGAEDLLSLRALEAQEIHPLLAGRLGVDLEGHLPARPGHACQGVVFLDTFEALRLGVHSEAQQHQGDAWVRELYAQLTNVLLVIAGRDRLTWEEIDGDWRQAAHLEQHLLGGLSVADARRFLGRCGVVEGRLQRAILAACVETDEAPGREAGYHPFSLGLCVDIVTAEESQGTPSTAAPFALRPGDLDALAHRFLRSVADPAIERWLLRLAQTPRFDEAAARVTFQPTPGAAQDAAWEVLLEYSFVRAAQQEGWWTLHPRMREALAERLAEEPGEKERGQREWQSHWESRSSSPTDDFAALAWTHVWALAPAEARRAWKALAEEARAALLMGVHSRLLEWWGPTAIEQDARPDAETARALNALGEELRHATVGSRADNLRRALAAHEAALGVFDAAGSEREWADTQHAIGVVLALLPVGDREENLTPALAALEAALTVRSRAATPELWAQTQQALGFAARQRLASDREASFARAFTAFEAALEVFTERDHPRRWAGIQHSLGNTWSDASQLPGLSLEEKETRLRRARERYQAALRVHTETAAPQEWAALQNNLGNVLAELASADPDETLQQAERHFEAALRVYTEAVFPYLWGYLRFNLGRLERRRRSGDRSGALARAAKHFQEALTVFREAEHPKDWAETQEQMALVYAEQGAEELARACLQAAVRGYRQVGMEQKARELAERLRGGGNEDTG